MDFQYTQQLDDCNEDEYLEEDDYGADKMLSHRPNAAVPGRIEFKVKWKGYKKCHDSWLPPSSFVLRITKLLQAYLAQKRADLLAKVLMAAIIQTRTTSCPSLIPLWMRAVL